MGTFAYAESTSHHAEPPEQSGGCQQQERAPEPSRPEGKCGRLPALCGGDAERPLKLQAEVKALLLRVAGHMTVAAYGGVNGRARDALHGDNISDTALANQAAPHRLAQVQDIVQPPRVVGRQYCKMQIARRMPCRLRTQPRFRHPMRALALCLGRMHSHWSHSMSITCRIRSPGWLLK